MKVLLTILFAAFAQTMICVKIVRQWMEFMIQTISLQSSTTMCLE